MENTKAIAELAEGLGLVLPGSDFSRHRELLAGKINEMINHDFNKLISVLYRLDVSEIKLKELLAKNKNMDAGLIIADLMIERQQRKYESRKNFKKGDNNERDEEERW